MRYQGAVCVVVDGYSTANALPSALAAYGYETVHLTSSKDLPASLLRSHHSNRYIANLTADGNLESILTWMRSRGRWPLCVVAGGESGVEVADALARRVSVPGNDPRTSRVRRHKALMSAAVAKAGVPTIPQLHTSQFEHAVAWARSAGILETAVKPPASSGSQGFLRCRDYDELQQAFRRLAHSRDAFGDPVTDLIVQPFIHGDEYQVNTVSQGGRTLVVDIWHTRKRLSGQHVLYDFEVLIDGDDPLFRRLEAFTCKALSALGIREGAAHTEIKAADHKLLFIETGARLMGSVDLSLLTATTGTNAVNIVAQSVLASPEFDHRLESGWRPRLKRQGAMVQMLSSQRGTLHDYALASLAALDTFHAVDTYLQPGDPVVPTVNSFTSPGIIFLKGETRQALVADYERIRTLERAGKLFRTQPKTA